MVVARVGRESLTKLRRITGLDQANVARVIRAEGVAQDPSSLRTQFQMLGFGEAQATATLQEDDLQTGRGKLMGDDSAARSSADDDRVNLG
jgi:hypothetical protein